MSYWLKMGFKEIKEDEILDYCIELSRKMIVNASEVIQNNKYYIPSFRLFDLTYENKRSEEFKQMDRNWLYNLFSFKLVYWKEYNLLGVVGDCPKDTDVHYIEFQNSCDQDYCYETWENIYILKEFSDKIKEYDIEKLLEALNEGKEYIDYEKKDIEGKLEYYRKTAIYRKIYKTLDLDNWLYDCEGNFKRFSIQSIDSTEKFNKIARILDVTKKELIEEFK